MPRPRTVPRVRPATVVHMRGHMDRDAGSLPSTTPLVVAGSYGEYLGYLARNKLTHRDVIYVTNPHTILGRKVGRAILVGTCEARRDYPTIMERLARVGAVVERDS